MSIRKYKTMPEESMNQEFRLKQIDEIRNCLIEELNQNELMSKKHKKVCRVFKYIELCGCVSIFAFASLVGIPIGKSCNRIKNFCNNGRN